MSSRAFLSLSLMIAEINPSRVGTGHAEPFGGAVYPQLPFSRREAGQALRFGHRPPSLFLGSASRLREIEYLLITAHDVDYLLSTERNLRRARWSLVGGRGCEHAGPRRQPRMDRATATRAYAGVLGRAALPPPVLTPAVPHMPKPWLCRRRQLCEDRHDQLPPAWRFRRWGRNYARCDHRS